MDLYTNYVQNEKRKIRYKNDADFKLKEILRRKLSKCINYYNITNQLPKMEKTYGVDWLAIMQHLWPMKPRNLYHVDHKKALSKFNLINKDGTPNYEEIKKAFCPNNLRWMESGSNMSKKDKSEKKYQSYCQSMKDIQIKPKEEYMKEVLVIQNKEEDLDSSYW